MKQSGRQAVGRGKTVFSRAGILRIGASASGVVLNLGLGACSDGGVGAEPEIIGKAEYVMVAQEFNSQSERFSLDSKTAIDPEPMTASVEEKARRGQAETFASAAAASIPAAAQRPFIRGKIVAAALSVDLNQVAADLKTAHLDGNPAADAILVSSILANDRYLAGSNGIIPNNMTPYSCCLASYPNHVVGMLYSFVTGALTLSNIMNVWTATTPRDSQEATVMVRQEGNLAFLDKDKVLLNRTHASWFGPSPYYVQLQVQSDTDPEAFRLCWHVVAPSVRRLSCGIYSRDSAAFLGTHVIDDSAGVGPRTLRTVDQQ